MKKPIPFIAIGFAMAMTAQAAGAPRMNATESDAQWVTLEENAKYTDALTDVFATSDEEPVYNVLEVAIQQDANDATHYRLVNPYKEWSNPYSCEVTYDESQDYYLEFYADAESGVAYMTRFYTGLSVEGKGAFGVEPDSNYYSSWYSMSYIMENFPQMFATFADGVVTYDATYLLEEYNFSCINGWYGEYNPYGSVVAVNTSGNFRIELPTETTGVASVAVSNSSATEYYDLQGRKVKNPANGIYIRVQGNKATKLAL